MRLHILATPCVLVLSTSYRLKKLLLIRLAPYASISSRTTSIVSSVYFNYGSLTLFSLHNVTNHWVSLFLISSEFTTLSIIFAALKLLPVVRWYITLASTIYCMQIACVRDHLLRLGVSKYLSLLFYT